MKETKTDEKKKKTTNNIIITSSSFNRHIFLNHHRQYITWYLTAAVSTAQCVYIRIKQFNTAV